MFTINTSELEIVCRMLATHTGLTISQDRLDTLGTAIREHAAEMGCNSFTKYLALLAEFNANDVRFQGLIARVTIGETFFFRDSDQFNALRQVVIPKLLEYARTNMRHVNILSAACSSGEEAYSLAILLREVVPANELYRFRIYGGDLNQAALRRALQGIYNKWSFRGVDQYLINRYFHFNGEQYQISDEIRQMVKFSYLNLAEELPYRELDLILLRNVTIYFNSEFIESLSARCQRALREGGWFIVGASELNQRYYGNFQEVPIAGATLYQKNSQHSATVDKRANPLLFSLSIEPAPIHKPIFSEPTNEPIISPTISQNSTLSSLSRSNDSKPLSKPNPLTTRHDTGSRLPLIDRYQEAEKLYHKNDLLQAEQILREIIDSDKRAQLLMAKIESQRGNNNASEKHLCAYLKSEPDSLAGHYLLGLIRLEDNRLADAAAEFRYTTFLDRNFAMGYWQLGLIYQRQGEMTLARRNFLQARRIISALPVGSQIEYSDGQNAALLLQTIDTLLQGVSA